jgi:hypothetical protein
VPKFVPGPTRSSAKSESARRAERRLIAAALRVGIVALPTDCPDLSPLLERLDALTRAEQPAA